MTAQKHTPGEWKYGVRKDGSMWLSIGNPDTGPHYQGDLVASEEDARLIVAAPDMLEALYEAEEYFDNRADADHDETGFVPNEEMKLLTVVRAAIAEATGQ